MPHNEGRHDSLLFLPPELSRISYKVKSALEGIPHIAYMQVASKIFPNGMVLRRTGIPTYPPLIIGLHEQVGSHKRLGNVVIPVVLTGTPGDPSALDTTLAALESVGNTLKSSSDSAPDRGLPKDKDLFHLLIMADARQDHVTIAGEGTDNQVIFLGEDLFVQTLAHKLRRIGRSNGVVALDLHSRRAVKFFREASLPFVNITAAGKFAEWIETWKRKPENENKDIIIASSDYGDLTRAWELHERTGIPLEAIIRKERMDKELEAELQIGNVKDKTVIIWDDMISSAGTAQRDIPLLIGNGAAEIIYMATHPVFAPPYKDNIAAIMRDYPDKVRFVITNSLPVKPWEKPQGTEIIDISGVITTAANILLHAESFEQAATELDRAGLVHELESPDYVMMRIKEQLNQTAEIAFSITIPS